MTAHVLEMRETDRFRLEDLFYSRTDKGGFIQSANDVFQFVADYDWPDLIGAPHKLVRHASMPRAVFKVMWSHVEAGETVGAYVVNRARDNTCYWVYAVVMPIEDGYLSVRLKPTSNRLKDIKALYAALRSDEDTKKLTVEDSVAAFNDALKSQGISSYEEFMTDALTEEMTLRSETLGQGASPELAAISQIKQAVQTVAGEAHKVCDLFDRTRQTPVNMHLHAARLEGNKGPISVVSDNHNLMMQQLEKSVHDLREAAELGKAPLQAAKFLLSTAFLMEEVDTQFAAEIARTGRENERDRKELKRLKDHYTSNAQTAVAETRGRAERLEYLCKNLRRVLSGMQLVRIACQIEQSQVSGDTSGINEIVMQLQGTENSISNVVAEIQEFSSGILDMTNQLDDTFFYSCT